MPAWRGASCTAAFNSARCSPVSAGGNLLTAQMTAPWDRPPQTSWPIGLWCGHPDPTPDLPPSPSIPRVKHGAGSGPAATSRATFPALGASAPDTSVVVPQPHPFATTPAVAPSPSCPTATPTPMRFPNTSSIANSTHRQCGFHLGFGLGGQRPRKSRSMTLKIFQIYSVNDREKRPLGGVDPDSLPAHQRSVFESTAQTF